MFRQALQDSQRWDSEIPPPAGSHPEDEWLKKGAFSCRTYEKDTLLQRKDLDKLKNTLCQSYLKDLGFAASVVG